MIKISFVILHYLVLEETIECIESILNLNKFNINISIIVVDNASSNDSFIKLKEKYNNCKNIYLLHSDINLGFARGNNMGFNYAKKYIKPDFIIMTNNDTVFKQKNFCKILVDKYKKKKFDIAGPTIITNGDSWNINPIPYKIPSKNDIKLLILKYKVWLLLYYLNLGECIKEKRDKKNQTDKESNLNDFKLHGCCLIFSKNYIKKYNGLYDKTFMYCEEDILKYISIRDDLKMVYIKDLEIIHKEKVSTNKSLKSIRKYKIFYYKNSIDSLKCLLYLINNN